MDRQHRAALLFLYPYRCCIAFSLSVQQASGSPTNSANAVGVLELLGVKAELTKTVECGQAIALRMREAVGSLPAVSVQIEMPYATNERVAAQGFDGVDGF